MEFTIFEVTDMMGELRNGVLHVNLSSLQEAQKLHTLNEVVTWGEIINRVWAMPNKWTFQIKPIAELLARYVGDGKGWIDPFLGSGTTAVACKKLGRKCIGIEIEEKYCKIAVERLRQSVMRLEV